MTKTKTATPSNAQQNGFDSTNPGAGGLATGAGVGAEAVRPATGALGG